MSETESEVHRMTPHFLSRMHARLAPRPRKPWWRRVLAWLVKPHACERPGCPMCTEVPFNDAEPDWSRAPGVWSEGIIFESSVAMAGEVVGVSLQGRQHAVGKC